MTQAAAIRMLNRLLETGAVGASQVPASARSVLQRLVETGAVRAVPAGPGMRYELVDSAAVAGMIRQQAPVPEDDASLTRLPARARAVCARRDTKHAAPDVPVVLLMRAVEPVIFIDEQQRCCDIRAQTALTGVAALAIHPGDRWRTTAPITLVENSEAFFCAERLAGVDRADCFVYYAGQLSRKLLEWLAEDRTPCMTLAADYDPVGLRNYLTLTQSVSTPVRLLVPDNLAELLKRFGKPSLLSDNLSLLPELLRSGDDTVLNVLNLLQLQGCGLEQEILIAQTRNTVMP